MLSARAPARRQTGIVYRSTFSEGYINWLERFKRILFAYKTGLIEESDLTKYQLFLLEYGQFNANFTLEELNKLHYPLSPFAIMHRHTYVRSTDNWAMEMLRINYQHTHRKRLFPIFLHSNLFWSELNRYCCVLKEDSIENEVFSQVLNEAVLNRGQLKNPIWIHMSYPLVGDIIGHKCLIEDSIKLLLFKAVTANNTLPENLLPLFEEILLKDSPNIKQQFKDDALLDSLEIVFPQVKEDAQTSHDALCLQFNEPSDLIRCDQCWFQNVFGMAKKYKIQFPTKKINNPNSLREYAVDSANKVNFLEFLTQVRNALRMERPNAARYTEVIKAWIKEHFTSQYQALSKQIVYFFQDRFKRIETIVFCDCSGVPEFVNSVMGNLGYRIDPVQAIRAVLMDFPLLFINAEQTEHFWDSFITTTMVDELPESEKTNIKSLKNSLMVQIRADTVPTESLLSFDSEWHILTTREFHPPFDLYAEYIKNYLRRYRHHNSHNRAFASVAEPEIGLSLRIFFRACSDKNLPLAIRCVQVISEVMLLDLENQPLDKLLPEIIQEKHLRDFPTQAVLMTPYAMGAFVRVFQILDSEYADSVPNVFVTNQSYFEWLSNLDRLDTRRCSVVPIRQTSEIEPEADIIFVEIHPNNVVETKQFAHNLGNLIDRMDSEIWRSKRRTLVIDATLNALDDEEILSTLQRTRLLVDLGWLNIILIQSLTKFSQLGIDKRSAGILAVINNGKRSWNSVNRKLTELCQIEPVDSSTINFFSYFFILNQLIIEYIARVNSNVRFVYTHIMEQFNNLEILSQRRFQITMSSDPRACYVALNMRGLLPDVDSGFSLGIHDIELFATELLNHFIHPLCQFLDLPLTERMSIGFPLCSVNSVFDSMRFTIGLEPNEQLLKYADMLAYVAFVLNRQRDAKLFFDDSDRQYQLRINYFNEKVAQFKAMTPGKNYPYYLQFDGMGSENSYKPFPDIPERQLKRIVTLNNGIVHIFREIRDPYTPGQTNFCQYNANAIYIPMRNIGDIPLSDVRIGVQQRRMVIACLTEYTASGYQNDQNVNLMFVNKPLSRRESSTVTFTNMEMLGLWNAELVYGPFNINDQLAFFHLFQKRISLLYDRQVFSEANICIRQGNTTIPLLDMPIEDREFFFREGSYEADRSASNFRRLYPALGWPAFEYTPKRFQPNFLIENNKLVVEHDFLCCQVKGIAIYKRYIDKTATCIEIDYWKEKDPVLSRFLTLMVAVFVKDSEGVSFLARNSQFCHLLFDITFDAANTAFERAAKRVSNKKAELTLTFQNYERRPLSLLPQYSFFTAHSRLSWPSGYAGVSHVEDGELIERGLEVLRM